MTTYCNYAFETEYQYSNLIDLLQYRAKNQSEQVAYRFIRQGTSEIDRITYQELDRQARAIAALLQTTSSLGERALLLYPPGLEFIKAFFGCLYAGIIAVPAYPPRRNQNMSRLQTLITEAQAKIALTTESLSTDIKSRLASESEFQEIYWLTTDTIVGELDSAWLEPQVTSDTLAFLQYTSGSTGTPKGVMITHGNLLHNERMIAKAFGHNSDTVVVGWLPLFHDMGLIGNVLQPLYLGRPCMLMSPVDFLQKPLRWLQAISHFQATTSGGPNFAYDLCVRKITPE
ncbi:MAG: AMP-binding protein, partial [Waterburya sp.]